MEKNIQLFCDTDATGKITRMLSGERIIPVSSYQCFLMIDKKEQANLDKYRVENGKLVQIEGTTLIEVENPNPSTEEQLTEVKKQLANMQKILDALTTPTVPEEPPTEEEPTDPPSEEPPVEEPATDEPTDETPVEEPTNPTE